MISQYNDEMTQGYKIVSLCMVRYIFSGIKVIPTFISLTHENIANKMFNIPNQLKCDGPFGF